MVSVGGEVWTVVMRSGAEMVPVLLVLSLLLLVMVVMVCVVVVVMVLSLLSSLWLTFGGTVSPLLQFTELFTPSATMNKSIASMSATAKLAVTTLDGFIGVYFPFPSRRVVAFHVTVHPFVLVFFLSCIAQFSFCTDLYSFCIFRIFLSSFPSNGVSYINVRPSVDYSISFYSSFL